VHDRAHGPDIVVTHALFNCRHQRREHQCAGQALLVKFYQAFFAGTPSIFRRYRITHAFTHGQTIGVITGKPINKLAGSSNTSKRRIGDIVSDLTTDSQLGTAIHLHIGNGVFEFFWQMPHQGFCGLIKMVVCIISGIG
jgi:hypothetical protein